MHASHDTVKRQIHKIIIIIAVVSAYPVIHDLLLNVYRDIKEKSSLEDPQCPWRVYVASAASVVH